MRYQMRLLNLTSKGTAVAFLLLNVSQIQAQQPIPATPQATEAVKTSVSAPIPKELARTALNSFGGEKFLKMKSLVLSGSADLYAPGSTQSMTAKFVWVQYGDKYRLEIQSPLFSFRQITDGYRSYTSVPGMEIPSQNRYGIPVLRRYNDAGFLVTPLPDRKKMHAFRITDPDGYATDYFVDAETGRLMSYESTMMGHKLGVEHRTFKDFDGILVPMAFTQRLAVPNGDFFAEFKVKDVKINQEIQADVFEIPGQ
jgi:hypothetical protein